MIALTDLIQNGLASALQSDFFAGGLALGAIGITAAFLTRMLAMLRAFVSKRIWVSFTIDNRSSSFRFICAWLEKSEALKHIRQVRVTGQKTPSGNGDLVPAPGRHWFRYGGKICCFERELNEKAKVGPAHNSKLLESITITVLFGNLATIQSWISEGKTLCKTEKRQGPALHVLKGDYWDFVGDVPRRGLETVLSDDDRIEKLKQDMQWFYGAKDWYAQRGVPWRRGYLLYGPPGTGKSSLIRALASDLNLDIASLDVSRPSLTDEDLREGMMSAPRKSLISIEDVDAVFVKRKSTEASGISFSGLLNAIDGVGAQEGRALLMTTNHPDRLDAALIRPGRADLHMELAHIGAKAATGLFMRFYPQEHNLAQVFQSKLGDRVFSPAKVQAWLLQHCSDPVKAATAEGLLARVEFD